MIYRPGRFKVTGFLDNIQVTVVFKNKSSAIKLANKISKGEVYDMQEGKTIYRVEKQLRLFDNF